MKAALKRWGLRVGLVAFLPVFFLMVLLAAPRMLIDWQLRRDWVEEFNQFFQKETWVDIWDCLKRGSV